MTNKCLTYQEMREEYNKESDLYSKNTSNNFFKKHKINKFSKNYFKAPYWVKKISKVCMPIK